MPSPIVTDIIMPSGSGRCQRGRVVAPKINPPGDLPPGEGARVSYALTEHHCHSISRPLPGMRARAW